jgi:hypothetical protein
MPRVTNETLEGIIGSVIENPKFLVDAAKSLRDQQPELVDLVSRYASGALVDRPPADVAAISVALAYEVLSRQIINDRLHDQHPEV